MANTSQSQGQDDIAFVDPSGTPSTNPTAQNASLARLVAASDTTEKIKSFRTLFASIAGYGRQNRKQLVKECIDFLPTRVELDLRGWNNDIFSHSS